MAQFIVINKEYQDDGAVFEQLFLYITRTDKAISNLIGSQYLYPINDAVSIGRQMREVLKLNSGNGRALWHFVLSFDNYTESNITPVMAYNIAGRMLTLFDGHQAVYAVHEDTDNLHVHFMINATNFYTGRKIENKRDTFENIVQMLPALTLDTTYEQKRLYCNVCYHTNDDIC